MAIPGSVSKSRWIAAAALVVLVIAAGAGWLLFGHAAKPPQAAAAPPPAPAVGVRLGGHEGRQPVLRVRRPHQGHRTRSSCGPASRASSRRCCSAKARTSRRATCSTRSRRCSSRRRSTRPRPISPSAEAERRPMPSSNTTAASSWSKRQFSPQSQVDQNKAALDTAAGRVMQAQGRADAGPGQPRLHRHPRADRRPHRPHRLHGRQSRQSGERRARDHRQPGSDLRAVPGERARPRDHPRSAAQGGAAAWPRSTSASACPTARNIRSAASGTSPIRRSTSRPTRLIMRATIPNPERTADRRPVRDGRHPRAPGSAAAGRAAGGAAGRPVRLLRAGRRRPAQGRAARACRPARNAAPTSSSPRA